MSITMDDLIAASVEQRPRIFFEIGEDAYQTIRTMRDSNGTCLWNPSSRPRESDTLLGYPIKIVAGSGARLITVVDEKTNIVNVKDL